MTRIPIPKVGKPNKYPPLAICHNTFCFINRIVADYTATKIEQAGLYHDRISAYRKGRGCSTLVDMELGMQEDACKHNVLAICNMYLFNLNNIHPDHHCYFRKSKYFFHNSTMENIMRWQQQVNHALIYSFPIQNNTLHKFLGIEKPTKPKQLLKKCKPQKYVPTLKPSIKFTTIPDIPHPSQDDTIHQIENSTSDTQQAKRQRQCTIKETFQISKTHEPIPLEIFTITQDITKDITSTRHRHTDSSHSRETTLVPPTSQKETISTTPGSQSRNCRITSKQSTTHYHESQLFEKIQRDITNTSNDKRTLQKETTSEALPKQTIDGNSPTHNYRFK